MRRERILEQTKDGGVMDDDAGDRNEVNRLAVNKVKG